MLWTMWENSSRSNPTAEKSFMYGPETFLSPTGKQLWQKSGGEKRRRKKKSECANDWLIRAQWESRTHAWHNTTRIIAGTKVLQSLDLEKSAESTRGDACPPWRALPEGIHPRILCHHRLSDTPPPSLLLNRVPSLKAHVVHFLRQLLNPSPPLFPPGSSLPPHIEDRVDPLLWWNGSDMMVFRYTAL